MGALVGQRGLAAMLVLFLALAVAVAMGWTMPLDQAIIVAVAGHRTQLLNAIALNVTSLGSAPVVVIVALLAAAYGVAAGHPRIILAIAWTPLCVVLDTALKLAVHHPRPTEAIIAIPDSYSFPSGHAVAASALYLTLALVASDFERRARPKRLIIAGGVIICLLVAWSRVYLGVHYFTDVVGGLLIGTAGAIVAAGRLRLTPTSS